MRRQEKICILSCLLIYYVCVIPAGMILFCVTTSNCDFGTPLSNTTQENEAVRVWTMKNLGCFFKNETFERFTFENLTENIDKPCKFRNNKCQYSVLSLLSRLH